MTEENKNPPLWKLGIGRGKAVHFPIILPEEEIGRSVVDEILPEIVNLPMKSEDKDTSIFADAIEEDSEVISVKSSVKPVEDYEDMDDFLKNYNNGEKRIKDFHLIVALEEYPRYNVLSDEEEAKEISIAAENVNGKKKKKSVNLNVPADHKSGYNPPRGSRCSIHFSRKRQKLISGEIITYKSDHYLLKEIFSEKYAGDAPLALINPLPFILNAATAFVDFVFINCNGPLDFYVRSGNLELRKLFKCLQYQMKVWYTSRLDVTKEFKIEEIQYLHFYVYYHEYIQEFVRCQVSEPVIVDREENPYRTVRVALIDYGGHEYIYFKNFLRLHPYFGQLPRMALRGTLTLTKILEYTDVQRVVFQNVIEYRGGVAEAMIARGNEEEFEDMDGGVFPVIEMIVFVMENGKRKNVDEILLAGESVHSLYLNHSDAE